MHVLKHENIPVWHFPRFTVISATFIFSVFPWPVNLYASALTCPSQPWHIPSSSGCKKPLPFLYHTCSFSSGEDKNGGKDDFAVIRSRGAGTYPVTFITAGTLIIHTANVTGDSTESHMTYFMWEMCPDEIDPSSLKPMWVELLKQASENHKRQAGKRKKKFK